MSRIVQLGNTANWQGLPPISVDAVTAQMENGSYIAAPIPDIEVPVLFDNFILAIRVNTSVPPNREWKFAGYVKQRISTGITIDQGQDATRVKSQALFLNQLNLVFFEKMSASYSISVKVPDWFTNAIISIWEYTGIDTDTAEQKLDQILINTEQ